MYRKQITSLTTKEKLIVCRALNVHTYAFLSRPCKLHDYHICIEWF